MGVDSSRDPVREFRTARALCCAEWGCHPGEFDRAAEAGEITAADVEDAVGVVLARAAGEAALIELVMPGAIEAARLERQQRANMEGLNAVHAAMWAKAEAAEKQAAAKAQREQAEKRAASARKRRLSKWSELKARADNRAAWRTLMKRREYAEREDSHGG